MSFYFTVSTVYQRNSSWGIREIPVTGIGSGVTVTFIVFFTPFNASIVMIVRPSFFAVIRPVLSIEAMSPCFEEYISALFVAFSGMIFTVIRCAVFFSRESSLLFGERIMFLTGISPEFSFSVFVKRLFLQDSSKKATATAANPINLYLFIIK